MKKTKKPSVMPLRRDRCIIAFPAPDSLKKRLKKAAKEQKLSMSAFTRKIVAKELRVRI